MFQPRTYRRWVRSQDLVSFHAMVRETDLYINTSANLKRKALRIVCKYREQVENYINRYPCFLTALEPFSADDDAPVIVRAMSAATASVGVGPMASVAGAIAEFVGNELLLFSSDVIIENGGDIYLRSLKTRLVAIYAGKSALSGKIGLEIDGRETPRGICTSSGSVGHSLSFGKADAVTVLSDSATLADAAATAIGNLIKEPGDIQKGLDFARNVEGITGLVIIIGDKMGVWGDVRLRPTSV